MLPKPPWLRVRAADTPYRQDVEGMLAELNLNTVCREASCPNSIECFSRRTVTFMILGTSCTRSCRFCNVCNDKPGQPREDEPDNVARAVKKLGLKYVVVTSVTRDDLPDNGSTHFSKTISAIRKASPSTLIEVLIPDLQGDVGGLKTIAKAAPDVISHNMETVKPLYAHVRPQADYSRSLDVLKNIKLLNPGIRSKSGIMLGFGETEQQVYQLFDDLIQVNCEFLTIGQYLAPSKRHLPVVEYVSPSQFDEYARVARQKGFEFVASAPLVRSSYHAGQAFGL